MYSELIVTPTPITLKEFQDFIRSWGGKWISSYSSNEEEGHGFIDPLDRDPAKIHLDLLRDLSIEFSQKDMEDLTKIFGAEPALIIVIGISSAKGSYDLAQDVIRDVIHRFGGIHAYVSKDVE